MISFEVTVDVTVEAGLGTPLETAATVYLPADQSGPRAVLVVYPGSGYNRAYYDIRTIVGYSQVEHHTDRGLIVISCDHLGLGDSSACDMRDLSLERLAATNHATAMAVIARLRQGTLDPNLAPLEIDTVVGAGQSMGGCLVTVQQANHRTFDGLALLGWSAIQEVRPERDDGWSELPGLPRDTDLRVVDQIRAPLSAEERARLVQQQMAQLTYMLHWHEDEPLLMAMDLANLENDKARANMLAPWRVSDFPGCCNMMTTRSVIEPEASVIDVPILIACGEVDCVADPRAEPSAYPASRDITVTVVPRMAHMHNFAPTREQLWDRIIDFTHRVAESRSITAGSVTRHAAAAPL